MIAKAKQFFRFKKDNDLKEDKDFDADMEELESEELEAEEEKEEEEEEKKADTQNQGVELSKEKIKELKKYVDPLDYETNNMIISQHLKMSLMQDKSQRNSNVLVLGASGKGKTYSIIEPNILQRNASFAITDPSGDILANVGHALERAGYRIRVLNLTDMRRSDHYNPIKYVTTETSVITLVTTLIKNLKEGKAGGGDPFWEKAEMALMESLIFYLIEQEDKNGNVFVDEVLPKSFASVMHLLRLAEVNEAGATRNGPPPKSPLDKLMEQLAARRKEAGITQCMAAKQYAIFKQAGAKTAASILVTTSVDLSPFNFEDIARLTNSDDMELDTLGNEKTALFIITPTGENSFNFLAAIMYSQLFDRLYYYSENLAEYSYHIADEQNHILKTIVGEPDQMDDTKKRAKEMHRLIDTLKIEKAENHDKYNVVDETGTVWNSFNWLENAYLYVKRFQERKTSVKQFMDIFTEKHLPVPVRFMLDEFANLGQIPSFDTKISTIRKYWMSTTIILQNTSQLTKIYEDADKTIIGNCDLFLYIGGNEKEMTEYVSAKLGNATIRVKGDSQNHGKNSGSSSNYSMSERALFTPEEIATELDRFEMIAIIADHKPFIDQKFNVKKHPAFLETGRSNKKLKYRFIPTTEDIYKEPEIAEKIKEEEKNTIASSGKKNTLGSFLSASAQEKINSKGFSSKAESSSMNAADVKGLEDSFAEYEKNREAEKAKNDYGKEMAERAKHEDYISEPTVFSISIDTVSSVIPTDDTAAEPANNALEQIVTDFVSEQDEDIVCSNIASSTTEEDDSFDQLF